MSDKKKPAKKCPNGMADCGSTAAQHKKGFCCPPCKLDASHGGVCVPDKKKPAKKRSVNKTWRIGYDEPTGRRVSLYGKNKRRSYFDEIVLGDWLHIEMMDEKDDCYWMRLGSGKDERVFFSYVKNGERVVRQDEGPGHD